MPAPPPNPQHHARYPAIDLLRGVAMVWMTVFHFCFDLRHFGYTHSNFYDDPFWTMQRAAIVSLFVFCAGLGQAVAVVQGQSWARFWRRWCQIAACAILVSIGSWFMFPDSFIYFGILHGIALMLLVVRFTMTRFGPPVFATAEGNAVRHTPAKGHAGRSMGLWLCVAGVLAVALPLLARYLHATWPALQVFNTPALNWLGLVNHKPRTEDYAPLMPWLGPMLWGLATGLWLLRRHPAVLHKLLVPAKPGLTSVSQALVWLGQHSLSYYMLHQPLLMGLLMLWGLMVGKP